MYVIHNKLSNFKGEKLQRLKFSQVWKLSQPMHLMQRQTSQTFPMQSDHPLCCGLRDKCLFAEVSLNHSLTIFPVTKMIPNVCTLATTETYENWPSYDEQKQHH